MRNHSDVKSNLNAFWTAFTLTFLRGLAGIWWLSERIQYGVNLIIVAGSDGVPLSGSYKLNVWIIFLILLLFLSLFIVCLALIRQLRIRHVEGDAVEIKSRYEDVLRRAHNLVEKINYVSPDYFARIDIVKIQLQFTIEPNGDTKTTRLYQIRARKNASLLEIAIEGDEESDPIISYRDVDFRALDKSNNSELDWIPTTDYLRLKRFAVFFPEIQKDEEKTIEVSNRWPGYLRRIQEKGSTEFWWFYMSASEGTVADVKIEWLYKRGFPHVVTRLQGAHGPKAKLSFEHRAEGMVWAYHDPQYRFYDRSCRIIAEKA